MSKPELKLDWCSHQAAKFAVMNWHYSKRMPDPKCVKVGVWENRQFIGVVLFSRGVSATNISKTLGIESTELAELSRVALTQHKAPTTKIVSIAIRMLKAKDIGLRMLISYADENQGHLGLIYQAGNWIYTGQSAAVPLFIDKNGKQIHDRACSSTGFKRQFGEVKRVPNRKDLIKVSQLRKWRYFYPLDAEMRKQIEPLAKPYPKRVASIDADAVAFQATEGGSTPTATLHKT